MMIGAPSVIRSDHQFDKTAAYSGRFLLRLLPDTKVSDKNAFLSKNHSHYYKIVSIILPERFVFSKNK